MNSIQTLPVSKGHSGSAINRAHSSAGETPGPPSIGTQDARLSWKTGQRDMDPWIQSAWLFHHFFEYVCTLVQMHRIIAI